MKPPASVYTHCDELDKLPVKNRKNWITESSLICTLLKPNASVLQVGCANGSRLIDLKQKRPDLHIVGIDIEEDLLSDARENAKNAAMNIETRLCDITVPEACAGLEYFDYVLCLNNTLGYIPDEEGALANMRLLGTQVLISVYSDQFSDELAREYFQTLGLEIQTIEKNRFTLKDFTSVKRYSLAEVESWGGEITETPLGYLCIL